MEFYIGGYAQGKLDYVLSKYRGERMRVVDGAEMTGETGAGKGRIVWNRFHLWVKETLEQGGDPEQQIEKLLQRYPDCIIISDEIGNGIVPLERSEREYRERTGRIQIRLAARAERVERVLCGIGQRLK